MAPKSTFCNQKTCEVGGNSKLDDRMILSHGRFVQVMGDMSGNYQEGRGSPELAKALECLCHVSGLSCDRNLPGTFPWAH